MSLLMDDALLNLSNLLRISLLVTASRPKYWSDDIALAFPYFSRAKEVSLETLDTLVLVADTFSDLGGSLYKGVAAELVYCRES